MIVVVLMAVLTAKITVSSIRLMKQTGVTPGLAFRMLFNTGAPLRSSDGRTNVLVLGIGGGNHEGGDLTDTMLVLSFNTKAHTMVMLSVPRDIWSDTLKDKINSAYHYGEEKKLGGGFVLSKAIVEDVLGLPIHYAFMIDFSGFTHVIDLIGGVDVTVPNAFTDAQFPIEGREKDLCGGDPTFACRYETIHFDGGREHMNGQRALQYVRSRHAEGDEGSDFARNRRQQDILAALKAKLVDPRVWIYQRPVALYKALDDATDTDMNIAELVTIGKLTMTIPAKNVKKVSIESLLDTPAAWLYAGKYVLVPKEDFDALHAFVKSQLRVLLPEE